MHISLVKYMLPHMTLLLNFPPRSCCVTWEEEDKGGLWMREAEILPSEEEKLKSPWRHWVGNSPLPAPRVG